MSITPNYVPREYKTLNIMLLVNEAEKALSFYNRAFGAELTLKLQDSDGIIKHAEMRIEDTIIMLAEASGSTNGEGIILKLYTGDVSAFIEEAVEAGCEVISPIELEFNGDRAGKLKDPFGFQWIIATPIEEVTATEMQRRFNEINP